METSYTVTEALVKLKLTSKKINDAIALTLVGAVGMQGSNTPPAGFKNISEFTVEIKKRLDSASGLIAFRDKLKKAIVESNAKTNVVIGKKVMTVAEAIETKHSIESQKNLLNRLDTAWRHLETQVEQKNSNLEVRADQYVSQLFQQNPSATEAEKANTRLNFIKNNMALIVTEDKTKEYISKLKENIDEFESNVDVALSIVNANTFISIKD